ncbi:hypothetical protein [Gluconobacter morbifer]|uniref:hypothetical protein n=1 Tax=Gluconobacter morbifer TaxID=479935 RepID=UPI001584DBAE|nr:hypothetical protein [Gluconobacter morbifer]
MLIDLPGSIGPIILCLYLFLSGFLTGMGLERFRYVVSIFTPGKGSGSDERQ